MKVTIYGIKSCGTVRKARNWLESQEIPYEWVDFRQTPVAPERVAGWVDALGSGPMRNTSGGAYRALGDQKKAYGDAEWLPLFQADPMLLKRPILELDGRAAAVGFKESTWRELFGH